MTFHCHEFDVHEFEYANYFECIFLYCGFKALKKLLSYSSTLCPTPFLLFMKISFKINCIPFPGLTMRIFK